MRLADGIKGLLLLGIAQVGWAGVFDKEYSDIHDYIVSGGPKDVTPAVTNPLFISADAATYNDESDLGTQAYVAAGDMVLGVVSEGVAKAYPLSLGWWHEVINDQIGDRFIAVTYCPLTGTGLVFDTTDADSSRIELGVSGWLFNSNLIMYDRRDDLSLYPQMVYTAINGAARGEKLKLLPVVETTWALWKTMYPDTKVAQFATGLERYTERRRKIYEEQAARYYQSQNGYPYGTYRTNGNLLFPLATARFDPGDLHVKETVLGICRDGQTKAYPFASMLEAAVVNDRVGGLELLVVFDGASRTALPYSRQVEERVLTFYAVAAAGGLPVEMKDVETGSRWDMLGRAVAGPLEGRRLAQVPAYNSMWFAWKAFWPETAVWEGEGILVPSTAVGGQTERIRPQDLDLGQNYPNPFNPQTHIEYDLPQSGLVRLVVYNTQGQRVRTLVEAYQAAGSHRLEWDGRDNAGLAVASGTYFYQLAVPQAAYRQTRAMVLVR